MIKCPCGLFLDDSRSACGCIICTNCGKKYSCMPVNPVYDLSSPPIVVDPKIEKIQSLLFSAENKITTSLNNGDFHLAYKYKSYCEILVTVLEVLRS